MPALPIYRIETLRFSREKRENLLVIARVERLLSSTEKGVVVAVAMPVAMAMAVAMAGAVAMASASAVALAVALAVAQRPQSYPQP